MLRLNLMTSLTTKSLVYISLFMTTMYICSYFPFDLFQIPLRPGSTVALITPMLPDGQVDVPSLRSLLQFHVTAGTDGLCILGTTGEASLMDLQERKSVLQIAVDEVKGKIPILVGTGAIDPRQVKEMILQAKDMGCDASLLVSPMYIKPPQRGLVQFYNQMADLGLPIVMYNVPGRTGVDIKPETIALCAQHENIVGVKEATGDLSRVDKIRSLTKDVVKTKNSNSRFLLYSGDDDTEAEFVLQGGDGCISVTANCAPKAMHDMMMACLKGNAEEARRINDDLKLLHTRIFCESNPIPAKWAVKRMGKIPYAFCRPPLMELDAQYYGHVEEALRLAKLIV